MAVNQTGIAIVIKAFLPIGKDLDEQLAALTLVKTAHETSDYSALLAAAHVDDVKTEQKTRRVDEPVPQTASEAADQAAAEINEDRPLAQTAITKAEPEQTAMPVDDDEVPAFLKKAKAKAA